NGDGKIDLLTANGGTNYFSILRNTGHGNFALPVSFTTSGNGSRAVAVGDFNEDGRPDVAVTNEYTASVSVFLHDSGVTYSIRGTVTLGGSGLVGVTVSAGSASAVTGSDGTYTLANLAAGPY